MTPTYTPDGAHPPAVKVFGREPAVFLGLIEATIMLFVVAFGRNLGLDGGFTVAALAVVSALVGAYSAYATKDTMLGALTGLAKAVIGLVLYFGLNLPVELQASILAFIAAGVGFWQRTQTSPVAQPIDPDPVQVAVSPVPAGGGNNPLSD